MSLEKRLRLLREGLHKGGEDALLVTNQKNVRYLSGFSGSLGWLLLTQDSEVLITDGRYWEQAARESPEVTIFKYQHKLHRSLSEAATTVLLEVVQLQAGSRICVETDNLTLATFRSLQAALEAKEFVLLESEGRIADLRKHKDSGELVLLRQAALIADRALSATLSERFVGRTELELKAQLEYQLLKQGGEGTSFSTIVASGRNGSLPHAGASDKVILEGELITIDFGTVFQGYCSDMTRTIWYGTLGDREKTLVAATRKAQALVLAKICPGKTCGEVDALARSSLKEDQLSEYFVHSLGHGIGLDIHEAPSLRVDQEDLLEVGHVVTVEPGVYLPNFTGCRVEDTVALSIDGVEILNAYPKQDLNDDRPPQLEET